MASLMDTQFGAPTQFSAPTWKPGFRGIPPSSDSAYNRFISGSGKEQRFNYKTLLSTGRWRPSKLPYPPSYEQSWRPEFAAPDQKMVQGPAPYRTTMGEAPEFSADLTHLESLYDRQNPYAAMRRGQADAMSQATTLTNQQLNNIGAGRPGLRAAVQGRGMLAGALQGATAGNQAYGQAIGQQANIGDMLMRGRLANAQGMRDIWTTTQNLAQEAQITNLGQARHNADRALSVWETTYKSQLATLFQNAQIEQAQVDRLLGIGGAVEDRAASLRGDFRAWKNADIARTNARRDRQLDVWGGIIGLGGSLFGGGFF